MINKSILCFALFLVATALAVVTAPWEPLPGETVIDCDYNDVPTPMEYVYTIPDSCEVNKAFPNWATKVAMCASKTTISACENAPHCYWRTAISQNTIGGKLWEAYATTIREIAPGIYDLPSQNGDPAGRAQVTVVGTGIVLYDCLDSVAEAQLAKEALRAIVGNAVDNVLAIFYSHSHVDHFLGCPGWVTQAQVYPNGPVHIYAHLQFLLALNNEIEVAAAITKRTANQLGNHLEAGPDGSLYPISIYVPTMNFFFPTDNMSPLSTTTIVIGGRPFVVMPLPGDTDSTIALYVPDRQTAFISSIYYRNQPFIGTIRGGAPRDITRWISSINSILQLAPVAIGVSHGCPMMGQAKIAYELTWMIQRLTYIKTYVLAAINQGLHPRDIAWALEEQNAYIRNVHGTTPFETYGYPYAAAMGMYVKSIGWYSGFVEELEPVNRTTEAAKLMELMGGWERTTNKAREVLKTAETLDDLRWGLQLAALAWRGADATNGDATDAKWLYSVACTRLGYLQLDLPKRNEYLSAALAAVA